MKPFDDHRPRYLVELPTPGEQASRCGASSAWGLGCATLALGAGQPADDRDTAFRAVPGGANTRSGTVLLVEAYAVMWLVVLVFVALSLRRQRRMSARIARLEQQLADVGRASPSPAGEPTPEDDS